MRVFRIILGALPLPFGCPGDVASKGPVPSPWQADSAATQRSQEKVGSNFFCGVQLAEGDSTASIKTADLPLFFA